MKSFNSLFCKVHFKSIGTVTKIIFYDENYGFIDADNWFQRISCFSCLLLQTCPCESSSRVEQMRTFIILVPVRQFLETKKTKSHKMISNALASDFVGLCYYYYNLAFWKHKNSFVSRDFSFFSSFASKWKESTFRRFF